MLKVGITGGMGSGKSTVARLFELLNVPVYYADDAAKKLMNDDPILKEKIIQLFGNQSYNDDYLNRQFLAKEAFLHPEKLRALNEIVHPAVLSHAEQWMCKQDASYTLKEAAIIFESGSYKQLDLVIGVWCPLELRIQRIMKRDGTSREEILARINKQMDEKEKMARCHFVITNDETQPIIPQVLHLHHVLLGKT